MWKVRPVAFVRSMVFAFVGQMVKTVFLGLGHVAFGQSGFLAIAQDLCILTRNSSQKRCKIVL